MVQYSSLYGTLGSPTRSKSLPTNSCWHQVHLVRTVFQPQRWTLRSPRGFLKKSRSLTSQPRPNEGSYVSGIYKPHLAILARNIVHSPSTNYSVPQPLPDKTLYPRVTTEGHTLQSFSLGIPMVRSPIQIGFMFLPCWPDTQTVKQFLSVMLGSF